MNYSDNLEAKKLYIAYEEFEIQHIDTQLFYKVFFNE